MAHTNGKAPADGEVPVEFRAAMAEIEAQRNGAMARAVALAAECAGAKEALRRLQASFDFVVKRLAEVETKLKASEQITEKVADAVEAGSVIGGADGHA